MRALNDLLTIVALVSFVAFGAVALRLQRVRPSEVTMWSCFAFGILGLTALLTLSLRIVPSGSAVSESIERLSLVTAALFPYFLYRMAAAFADGPLRFRHSILALTVASVVATALLGTASGLDESTSSTKWRFVALFNGQWLVVMIASAWLVYSRAGDQPDLVRMRMNLFALAISLLPLAALLFTLAENTPHQDVINSFSYLMALASLACFSLSAKPPLILVYYWRRNDERRLGANTPRMIEATTAAEGADALLPGMVALLGATAAELWTHDDTLIYRYEDPGARESLPDPVVVELNTARIRIFVSSFTLPFTGQSADIVRSVSNFLDNTIDRIEHTEHDQALQEEVKNLNLAMRDLIAATAHDLRTPITVISGLSTTMSQQWETLDDDTRVQFFGSIRRQSDQLRRIVDDMFTLSRMDANALDAAPQPVAVAPLVAEILTDLEGGASATTNIAQSTQVFADPFHLRRILTNYLENAFNYGESPIEVTATTGESFVELRVTDRGRGVPDSQRERLFQRFEPGALRGKRRSSTGLGLYIVRGLAEANGGRVWYEDLQPRGACFCLSLPRSAT